MKIHETTKFQDEPRPRKQAEAVLLVAFNLARKMWRDSPTKQSHSDTDGTEIEFLYECLKDKHFFVHEELRCSNAPKQVPNDIPIFSEDGVVVEYIWEGDPIDPNEPYFLFMYHPLFGIWRSRLGDYFRFYGFFFNVISLNLEDPFVTLVAEEKSPMTLMTLLPPFLAGTPESWARGQIPQDHVVVAAFEDALEDAVHAANQASD